MEKIIFEDLPSTNTPINSTNLNQLQDNVDDALGNLNILGTIANGSGSIVIGKLSIEWGQVSITSTETSSVVEDINIYSGSAAITYVNTYKNTPQVATFWKGSYYNQLSVTASNGNTTGCTIYGRLLTANSTRPVGYLVIGEIAE